MGEGHCRLSDQDEGLERHRALPLPRGELIKTGRFLYDVIGYGSIARIHVARADQNVLVLSALSSLAVYLGKLAPQESI